MTARAETPETPSQALVHRIEPTSPVAVMDLLRLAIDKGIPVDVLEQLQTLHERVTDRQASAEFSEAIAEFQKRCPAIGKNAKATVPTRSGGSFSYTYADLPEITKTIAPHLRAVGLAYTWDSALDKGTLTCTCILRHVNGHRETAHFACPVETSAGMSDQQKVAAALSFARRQSLIQVLGLVTSELEEQAVDPTPITPEQAQDLEDLCEACKVDKKRVLKWLKVQSFDQVPVARFEDVVAAVKERAAK